MVDRIIVYPSALPLDSDILLPQQNSMVALGYMLQASFGQNTVVVGLNCIPSSPPSMQINITPGAIVSPNVIEATPFGSLPADTADPLVKMGINIAQSAFLLSAPTTAGQSQNYLVQAAFSEADAVPETLTYFNSANPNQPFTGPGNTGTQQNTQRVQRANLQLKVGTPAATGQQVTPPVDTGWTGLWVITVNYGQTSITSAAISQYPSAPFLVPFLASHHGGVPGQAPKINLATEVQGVLPAANLPSAVGSSLVYAGDPNGNVAGVAASGTTPPEMCWDTVHDEWWTCVTSGDVAGAKWISANNSKNIATFFQPGTSTWTPPAGVTKARVTVVGGGGGGGGGVATDGSTVCITPGGSSGSWGVGVYTISGPVPITVGSGGAAGASGGGAGGTGGTSSFGTFLSAPGGPGSIGGVQSAPPVVQAPPPTASVSVGGNVVNGAGQSGMGGACGSSGSNAYGGPGANGPFGGGAPASINNAGYGGTAPGAGGSGVGLDINQAATSGGPGAAGCVIIEW